MCYKRETVSLLDTMQQINFKDIRGRFILSIRAGNIITHLWRALEMEEGSEVEKIIAAKSATTRCGIFSISTCPTIKRQWKM